MFYFLVLFNIFIFFTNVDYFYKIKKNNIIDLNLNKNIKIYFI